MNVAAVAFQQPEAVGDTVIHTVSIDAIAVDPRGAAISTLTPRDFELREDGRLHAIEEARFVTNSPRLVAIYLDEYHITAGASADRAREALTAFVDREPRPCAISSR